MNESRSRERNIPDAVAQARAHRRTNPGDGPSARGRRKRELASLNAIAEVLNRSTDLSVALTGTLTLVAGVLGLHAGWVWLLNERGEFIPAAVYHLPPHLQRAENMTGWHCLCLRTFLAGDLRGAANVNVLECSRLAGLIDGTDGIRFHASIPIYVSDRKIGVMNVAGPEWRKLSGEELQYLYTIGYQVGVAIERTRLLEARTRLAETEERNRLAREIHDTVAQGLAGLTLQLEAADALLARDPLRAREAIQRGIELSHAVLDEVRRSVLDLRAAPLEGLTLVEALRRLVKRFGREQGIRAICRVDGAVRALSPRIEVGVFRVAEEALANAAQHAHAESLRVRLSLDGGLAAGGRLHLTVEDDGRGFDPAEPVGGHYGLLGMRERAHLLGGRLDLASAPGAGTRVELDLPLA
ncbi:MAG TPA: GAF domain-containing sensor histidine kinase [Steroidobacteraceae bacterium]|nr:GAF domain-containing sensor histidine kinase [Steroidobacteraceae bacterium]